MENLTGNSTISACKKLQVECFIKGGWKVNRTHTAWKQQEGEGSGLEEPNGGGRQAMNRTGAARA